MERIEHDEALGRDAGLAVVDEAGADRGLGSGGEVGAFEDEEGVGAAELEERRLERSAGGSGHDAAGAGGAGEGDRGDAGVADEPLGLQAVDGEPGDEVVETGAGDAFGEQAGAARQMLIVLEQDAVAGRECAEHGTDGLPVREVPGQDGEDEAERARRDGGRGDAGVGAGRNNPFGGKPALQTGGDEAAGLHTLLHLFDGLGVGAAHLAGGERGEFGDVGGKLVAEPFKRAAVAGEVAGAVAANEPRMVVGQRDSRFEFGLGEDRMLGDERAIEGREGAEHGGPAAACERGFLAHHGGCGKTEFGPSGRCPLLSDAP